MQIYLPNISVDCVVFGFHDAELKVLLLKLKNLDKWALPGGFVEMDKTIDNEAISILKQRTGLDNIFLKQFYTFGDLDRNDPKHVDDLVKNGLIPEAAKAWFNQRFLSIGYYALVEYSKVKEPQIDGLSESCDWCSLKELPNLMLDHQKIIEKAYRTLKRHLETQPVGLNLLADEFTMPELQTLYEIILDTKLDRRNFRRKILASDILIDTGKTRTGLGHKSPKLYSFNIEKYEEALENGFYGGFR